MAIKLLPPQLATDHAFVARFCREADAADVTWPICNFTRRLFLQRVLGDVEVALG